MGALVCATVVDGQERMAWQHPAKVGILVEADEVFIHAGTARRARADFAVAHASIIAPEAWNR